MYGFRLRTRDHTWLCGQLFIDERADSSKPGSELLIRQRKVGNRYSPKTIETATVSRLHVIAWESEE
jgi:hypothetical protein